MKIMLVSDPHLRRANADFRIDKVLAAGLKKIQWIQSLCKKEKVDTIVLGGDIFDEGGKAEYRLIKAMQALPYFTTNICYILGQHDRKVGEELGAIDVCAAGMHYFQKLDYSPAVINNIIFYGVDHTSDIEEAWEIIERCNEHAKKFMDKYKKILTVHLPISNDKHLIKHGVVKKSIDALMKITSNFDLVHMSDIHIPYCNSKGKTTYVNTGPLMRLKSSLTNYIPHVYIYDTKIGHGKFHAYDIPVIKNESYFLNKERVKKLQEIKEAVAAVHTPDERKLDPFDAVVAGLCAVLKDEGVKQEVVKIFQGLKR